jgi:DNA repair protein SbcC/Rad50
MRILAVRFKNLNSLTGEWQIDFTHQDYASDGIFAITGPTGAGKTTILDAICLGLYGRTPRLDKVTKSSNEVMSRQEGECFAEVTFETQKGRYRCHWSQHRARRQPEGELQQARHEIADADSDAVLESKIAQVGEFIEKATGMDFERFTRSMLLAQGGFAAFLQADPDKRSPILEQITGTEIYSQISMMVHKRKMEEQSTLDTLKAELSGMHILGEEEVKELQTSLNEKREQEADLAGKAGAMREALAWLDGIVALEKELNELDKKRQNLKIRKEAFNPESKKLEKSRKALTVEGDYRGVAALRAQQAAETKEHDEACAGLPEKEKACAHALAGQKAAETLLNEAQASQQAATDVIKEVRELDARLGEQKKQLAEKDQAIAAAGKQGAEYKGRIDKASQAHKTVQVKLQAVHDYRTKHAADAALLENLTAIARAFESLQHIRINHEKACIELAAAERKKQALLAELKKCEKGHEKDHQEFETGQKEQKALAATITTLLKGRDISQWRSDIDALKDRERLLIHTGETIQRIEKAYTALAAAKKGLEQSKALQGMLIEEISICSERKVMLEKAIADQEIKVSLLNRIHDLEEERKRLVDGSPCPLCGAADHPYAKGNVPALNEADKELAKTKTEFKTFSEKLGKAEAAQARAAAEIQHAEKDLKEKKAALDADEKQCVEDLLKLNIEANEETRSMKVHEALASVRAEMADTSAIVAAADDNCKKELTAQKALETLRVTYDGSGKALQEAIHKLETASLDCVRLEKDGAALAEQMEKAAAAALKDVEPFGITQLSVTGLDAARKNLTMRKETWQAKLDEKTAHEKMNDELKAAIDKDMALMGNIEADLAARKRERDELAAHYESLLTLRRELFGEMNTAHEEKRLAVAVEEARKSFEKARDAHGKLEKEISALKEKITSLKVKIGNRSVELMHVEKILAERITRAGFANEADYLASCLTEEERDELARKEVALLAEETGLHARIRDKEEALQRERQKQATELPRETLRQELSACESVLKQLREAMGAIKNSLSENEKHKNMQQERIRNMEAREKECARWDNLHHLIGSADGKKFRNFAQGLTFEMMTAHANQRLKKMTNRYLLIRDATQPLELNVIDNYQAGEIRSTKNLSGGESFIVSLALALGLSHMASRNVRIDSLFLDEGFGALDEDALDTALETLSGLQQDGKLIGIISHVTALKERISTQIQVTPEAGGRSVIAGPGCRRV